MDIFWFLLGIANGGLIVWILLKSRFGSKNKMLQLKLDEALKSFSEIKQELSLKEGDVIELNKQLAWRSAEYKGLNEKLKEQKEEISNLQERFRVEFKNLANEILEEKTQKFTEQNKTNLDQILKPLNEKIKDFEKKVEETYDKESQQRFSLKEEVKRLAELNQQVSLETSNLTKALKGESKAQGDWGEMILENILEKSGLVKDREYFIQASYKDDQGRNQRPDVVVSYPGERSVVVDSKVSLTAYEQYFSAEDDKGKEKALKEHLQSIKNHIKELSEKKYQDLYELKTLDFVMMFLPIEPAYLLAIHNDPDLWNLAYDKRILLIGPTNLIAALKMVESMWKQEYQSKNVMEIARQSGALYDKFVGLVNDLIDVGNKLKSTQGAYESSMNKLSDGKGSLVDRVEKIKKLGAKTSKEIPTKIVERVKNSSKLKV